MPHRQHALLQRTKGSIIPFAPLNRKHSRLLSRSFVREAVTREGIGGADIEATKLQIDAHLSKIGLAAALLPGSTVEKAAVDQLLVKLQQARIGGTQQPDVANNTLTISSAEASLAPSDLGTVLPGKWQLVYASNGTVVTRTWLASVLVAANQLPGVGLSNIQQTLSWGDSGSLLARNELQLGLGPGGTWLVAIEGQWYPGNDKSLEVVQVAFSKVTLKLVGLLGIPLPDWLPQVTLPLGGSSRGSASWYTPYADASMRIGRGTKSGNVFLFRKQQIDSKRADKMRTD